MSISNTATCQCPKRPRFAILRPRDWRCPTCGQAWFSVWHWNGRTWGWEWLPAGKAGQA